MKVLWTLLLLVATSIPASASGHRVGSWILDTAFSTYRPGPMPRCVNLRYEAVAGGVKVMKVTVDAQGKRIERTTTPQFLLGATR